MEKRCTCPTIILREDQYQLEKQHIGQGKYFILYPPLPCDKPEGLCINKTARKLTYSYSVLSTHFPMGKEDFFSGCADHKPSALNNIRALVTNGLFLLSFLM